MPSLIDVLGSLIIIGIILLTVLGVATDLGQASYDKTFTLNLQTNAVTAARILESDFVKIGYRAPTKPAISYATTEAITFKSDLQDAGTVNTVQYFVGPLTDPAVALTKNPRDRVLYRVMDGQTIAVNIGITEFGLAYFDSVGAPTTDASRIKSIRLKVRLESPERVIQRYETDADSTYPGVFWEKTIFPRNI